MSGNPIPKTIKEETLREKEDDLQSLIAAAEEAEANFDHETAVAHYTAALELPGLTPEERYAVLDGRAKVYVYWGDGIQLAEDYKQLVDVARQIGNKRLLAEALVVGGFYWRYWGTEKPSLALSEDAHALAQEFGDERLIGFSFMALALAHWHSGDTERAFDFMKKSLSAARRSGDSDLLFYITRLLSVRHLNFNEHAEAQRFAAEARALAEKSGNAFYQGNAYRVSGMAETDLALVRSYFDQAFKAEQIANSRSDGTANNMGLLFWRLGLYGRALDYASGAVEQADVRGLSAAAGNYLDGLGRAYMGKGLLDDAEKSFRRGYELTAQNLPHQAYHSYGLAEVMLASGRLQEAITHFQNALETFGSVEPVALAGLGAAYFIQGDLDKALEFTGKGVAALNGELLLNEYHGQEIWWRHYQVLLALKDEEAFSALDTAKRSLLTFIKPLSDEGLRRNYLNKVPVNNDITLAWTAEAAGRGLSTEVFTAHEPVPGNLREQFRRVVDIGSRLAAEHDPETLADFIVEEFVEMSGAERVLLLLLDEKGNPQVAAGFNPEDALVLAGPVLESVRQSRRPQVRLDVGDVPEGAVPEIHTRSLIALPLITQGRFLGLLYGDMRQVFGRFDESDTHLLGMLANQAASALENAHLVSELEGRVAERTAELQASNESLTARNSELAVINRVQAGLADRLDLQSIYDLVGETIVGIFQAQTVTIAETDLEEKRATYWYAIENGRRLPVASAPFGPGASYLAAEKNPLYLRNPQEIKAFYPDLEATMMEGESAAAGSWLQVPLLISGRLSGVISLEDQRPNAFSESDVSLLSTLANSLTVAIENARLFDETQHLLSESQQRNAELAIINSVQEALVAEMDMEAIYEIVGDKIVQILDTQVVTINRLNHEAKLNEYVYSFEYGQHRSLIVRPITPVIQDLIRQGEPVIVNTGTDKMRTSGAIETVDGADALSFIIAPLKRGDLVTGYVSVQNTERENAFEEADLRLLTTLVASLNVALENARLFNETTHRAREMAALTEVGRDISATLNLSDVLERIAAHALELLNVSNSTLFLPDEAADGDEPVMRGYVALGPIAEQVKATTIRPGQGILGHIWQTREAELLNGVSSDPRALPIDGTKEQEEERMMVAPLLSGDEVIGLMAVWRAGKSFDQDDLQFLDGLSRQAAIAIKNAQLFSDAELARTAAIRANESKSAFLSNMSHELRTPLNAVIGFTRIVQRKTKDILPQKQLDNLDKILSSGEHLLGLINTILDIAKIEAGRMDLNESRFQIGALVEYLAMTMQPLLRRGVILKTEIAPDLPSLLSDQEKVKQILLNLLSNAAKFTHEGSITIRAFVGAHRDAPLLAIEVADTGIGVSEEALGRIFEEFQQADELTRRHYGGTGLGLSISKQLAQLLGGDITAASQPGQGSTFTLYLPLGADKPEG